MRLTPPRWIAIPTIDTKIRVLADQKKNRPHNTLAIVTSVTVTSQGYFVVACDTEGGTSTSCRYTPEEIEPLDSVPRTITLPELYSFGDALLKLDAGKCVGIRPTNQEGTNDNMGYVIRFHPKWMNPEGPGRILCWADSSRSPTTDSDGDIRVDQFLGKWKLVILDCSKFHP